MTKSKQFEFITRANSDGTVDIEVECNGATVADSLIPLAKGLAHFAIGIGDEIDKPAEEVIEALCAVAKQVIQDVQEGKEE